MLINQVQFLLDENVDQRVIVIFQKFQLHLTSVQKQGWSGYKNGLLCQKIVEKKYILVTRDVDFTFLWKKHNLRVIYLGIKPPLLSDLIDGLINLFNTWKYDVIKPFLIIIQKDSIRVWI